MLAAFGIARRRCVPWGILLAITLITPAAWSALAGPQGLVCPRSHDTAQCPVERTDLPPLDEPLVPREVPNMFRTAVQQQLAAQHSPVEYTWHLSIVRGGYASRTVRQSAASQPIESCYPWQRAPWDRVTLLTSTCNAHPTQQQLTTFGQPTGRPICGDFNGDGRNDLGVFLAGEWFIDLNGNHRWDKEDLYLQLGATGDQPVTGDWDGDGKTDIGIFGPRWDGDDLALEHERGLPDVENAQGTRSSPDSHTARAALPGRTIHLAAAGEPRREPIDHVLHFGAPGDRAVVGDFNGDGIATVGVYRAGRWLLDVNGNGQFDSTDKHFEFGTNDDLPVVADLDDDGRPELGLFRAGQWRFDLDHNGQLDEHDPSYTLGQVGDLPLIDPAATAGPRLIVTRPASVN